MKDDEKYLEQISIYNDSAIDQSIFKNNKASVLVSYGKIVSLLGLLESQSYQA